MSDFNMADRTTFGSPLLARMANLTLIVGPSTSQKRFEVTAENLRLASKVFDAMLRPDGPFWKNGAKEIKLPDDDSNAFELMLKILYHDVKVLSQAPSFDQLWQLSVLADKYDMHPVVQAHFLRWCPKVSYIEVDSPEPDSPTNQV